MDSSAERSDQVIKDFKKQKLASSALRRVHRLIESYDEGRKSDIHWARVGLITLAILLLVSLSIYLFGTTEVKIN
jgi:hypothetical protein